MHVNSTVLNRPINSHYYHVNDIKKQCTVSSFYDLFEKTPVLILMYFALYDARISSSTQYEASLSLT